MNASRDRLDRLLGYLAHDAANFTLLAECADMAIEIEDHELARQLVDRALALDPHSRPVRYMKAVLLLYDRKAEEALTLTLGLLDEGESDPAIRFAHCRGLAIAGRFEEAASIMAALVGEGVSIAELPRLYIRTLHFLGKVGDAIRYAEEHLIHHPEDGTVTGMLGLLYIDNNDFEHAAQAAKRSLDITPDNRDALMTAGFAALGFEKIEPAKQYFTRAVSLYPANGRAWTGLGLAHLNGQNLGEAEHALQQGITHMPSHLGTRNALAWVHILQRNYAAARDVLEEALKVNRNFGETHGSLAVLSAFEGDWDVAQTLCAVALRLQPDSFSGRFAQSLIQEHRGNTERARFILEEMLARFKTPGNGNFRETMMRYVSRQGKPYE